MTRCESYPPCFGTIYFPTAPFLVTTLLFNNVNSFDGQIGQKIMRLFVFCAMEMKPKNRGSLC